MEENKQGYVDTPERIDAFQDAIWDSGLSMRAKIAIHGMCETPAQLKEVIDNDRKNIQQKLIRNFLLAKRCLTICIGILMS